MRECKIDINFSAAEMRKKFNILFPHQPRSFALLNVMKMEGGVRGRDILRNKMRL
jgi:hypothetical protein